MIELLAVVVILLAISVIAVSSISAVIKRNNVKKDNATKAVIVSYGENYASEFMNSFTNCLNVATLKGYYNLDIRTLLIF